MRFTPTVLTVMTRPRWRRRRRRRRPPSRTPCASSGRTTSPGRGWRSSASPTTCPTCPRRRPGCSANQEDIGDAIKPFYGRDAGNQLTALLKEHIVGAVALLQAAKAGDQALIEQRTDAWYANGNEIADFLAAGQPAQLVTGGDAPDDEGPPRPDPRTRQSTGSRATTTQTFATTTRSTTTSSDGRHSEQRHRQAVPAPLPVGQRLHRRPGSARCCRAAARRP